MILTLHRLRTASHWIYAALALSVITACSATRTPTTSPAPAPATPTTAATEAVDIVSVRKRATHAMQRVVDSLVALPQFSNAHWGVLIVVPTRGDTLASANADRLVMPASNQKIVTGAVALAQLGPDYQWRTTFSRTGRVVRGVLNGDIIVSGSGDPSVSTALRRDPLLAFDPLIAALKRDGIRRISGTLRAPSTPAFPGSPVGFGWDYDDLDAPYGAGVTELLFNEGFAEFTVRGCAAVGALACVTSAPVRTSPQIRTSVITRAAGTGRPEIAWWRDSAQTPGITFRGSIAAGDSIVITTALADGRSTYLAAVAEALQRAGIQIERPTRKSRAITTSDVTDTIVVLQSLPLRDVLPAMQKPSQNQIAEAIFRTLGLQATGVGTPDSARAVVERQLTAWGVRADAHAVRDGSGLSRHDYITPRAIVQILDAMRTSPNFRTFVDALPFGGDGTLRNRLKDLGERVHAKTGTIDKARALSGYTTSADGQMIIFSLIANNFTVSNREIERIQDLIVTQLAALRLDLP